MSLYLRSDQIPDRSLHSLGCVVGVSRAEEACPQSVTALLLPASSPFLLTSPSRKLWETEHELQETFK